MKALVAVTCIAVLAAVGFFFWGEYSEHRANSVERANKDAALQEMFSIANAEPNDTEKVRRMCQNIDKLPTQNDLTQRVAQNCRFFGYR